MTDKYRRNRDIQAPPSVMPDTKQMGPRPVKIFLALISSIVLVISGAGYFTIGKLGNTVASAGNLSLGGDKGMKEAADGATDILLVGSDSRTDAQGNPLSPQEIELLHAGDEENDNTDTIMVIRIPNDGSSATAISIPRDTYVHDNNLGNLKINGVYKNYKDKEATKLLSEGIGDRKTLDERSKQAGRQALISAVSDLTGITVDHYAEVGLLGFVLLTEAVGGVEVCLNNSVKDEYSGADFGAGRQTLKGGQALAFVRQRHGLPRGDLDRIVRQQAFMASLVNKVLSSGTLTNPQKLADMGKAVERSVVIDQNWDVMSFANQLQNLAGGNVRFNTIPVTSIDGTGDYGESVVTVDVQQVHKFFDQLLNGGPKEEPSSQTSSEAAAPTARQNITVDVLNATTTSGLAAEVAGYLKTKGHTIAETGNAPQGLYSHSQILATDPESEDAKRLSQELGDIPVVQHNGLDLNSYVVVAASDYAGPKSTESATSTSTTTSVVGQPGADEGQAIVSPEIDAGGNGPRCVN